MDDFTVESNHRRRTTTPVDTMEKTFISTTTEGEIKPKLFEEPARHFLFALSIVNVLEGLTVNNEFFSEKQ